VGSYRVTVQEAAKRLGVKEGAIRKRIERGTIESEKEESENGRVYVYVDEPPVEDNDAGHDNGYDTGYDAGYDMRYDASYPAGYDMLIRSQQEQIEFLRRELERKDAILLNMTEGLKSLEAPRETPEEPETASPEMEGVETPLGQEKPVTWWRRFFGV
jgi:hypothetical protein